MIPNPADSPLIKQLHKIYLPDISSKTTSHERKILLRNRAVVIPLRDLPLKIILGKDNNTVCIAEDAHLLNHDKLTRGCLIYEPQSYPSSVSGFLRLHPRNTLTLGCHSPLQEKIFKFGQGVSKRHLSINHLGDSLLLRDLDSPDGTHISLVKKNKLRHKLARKRLKNFVTLRNIIGSSKTVLPKGRALSLIRQVNAIPWGASLRPKDDRGLPGGLLRIPDHITPIILGDLHTNLDNLLTILSVNGFLHALQEGTACLIILGDSVHCELGTCLAQMGSSMVMMDIIFQLMLYFPQQVYYLRGNHDSFDNDVYKGGVPQGQLWQDHLLEERGEEYLDEMNRFYHALPVLAVGKDFITCHASPPNAPVTEDMIVNIYKYSGLSRILTWNRLRRPNHPAGYVAGDIRRLRESFQLPDQTPFIVAHTPMSREGTLWTNVSDIRNHHIVYSGRPHHVALFTRVGNTILPMVYFSDAAQEIMDEMEMIELMNNCKI